MSEELKVEVAATDAGGKDVTPVEPQFSEVEQKALDQGWVPQDQWQGDPNEWRPAKEYVERGELYKSIHQTKRELKQTQAALNAQMRHHQYVFEKAYQAALKQLQQEKRQAIREQDFDKLEAVEAQIEAKQIEHQQDRAQLVQAQQVANAPQATPEFQAFLDRNPWYSADDSLRLEADIIGGHFVNSTGDRGPKLLEHVEKEIKKRYPEKFGGSLPAAPKKVAAPAAVAAVDKTGRKASAKEGTSLSDVPEHMRDVVRNFAAASGISQADYIKQLKEIGAI